MQNMPQDKTNSIIKVIGVGGGGCIAINNMIQKGLTDIDFITVDTDPIIPTQVKASQHFQLTEKVRLGLDGGGDPYRAEIAAENSTQELFNLVRGADLIFIVSTFGGGTGTGAAPVVARIAKQTGALTICVVTKSLTFEGTRRNGKAIEGINKLKKQVDTLIYFDDDQFLETVKYLTLSEAFKVIDDVLFQCVKGICELINLPNLICLDFNEIREILSCGELALMLNGRASGEDRALQATKIAISTYPLGYQINDIRNILVNITSGPDLALIEVNQAIDLIRESVNPNTKILFGASIDQNLVDEFHVTAIAIGNKKYDVQEVNYKFHIY